MEQSRRHGNRLPSNLPQLQNLIKRDPPAYHEEFMQQYHHYQSLQQLLLISPSQESPRLAEVIMFLGQVTPCYPEDMGSFPVGLRQLLQSHSTTLHPNVRMTLCRALILLRNKGVIEPKFVLELFFELFRCQDKTLRSLLYSHIVSDIKRINAKHKNNRVNKTLQNFMYTMLNDSSKVAARMSLDVMVELYKKNIWRDTKTVNVLATACLSPVTKIMGAALRFFLTGEEEGGEGDEGDSESSDESGAESRALRDIVLSRQTVKSGRKRERKVARARAVLKKQRKKRKAPPEARFMALHLIHDPQDFAEKLFRRLEKATEKFELRLMMMALIARLTGVHQLFVLNFYPFLQRYLQPHQKEVTKVMTYLAQASHDLVPPEVLEPVVMAVANNFITERNSSDAIAMGLNTMRELCVRCPLVMSRELLADLAGYKSYKDKGVAMAARSLVQLYRTVRPELLQRKDRGRPTVAGPQRARQYGELVAEQHVPGMELVDLPSEPNPKNGSDTDVSESSSGWVDIHHSSDEEGEGEGGGDRDVLNTRHSKFYTIDGYESDSEDGEGWEEGEEEEWVTASDDSSAEEEGEEDVEKEEEREEDVEKEEEGEEGEGKGEGSVTTKDKLRPDIGRSMKSMRSRFSCRSRREAKRQRKRRREEERREDGGRRGEEVEGGEVAQQLKKQRVERAAAISQSRLLTDAEFQQLRVKQACANRQPRRVDAQLLASTEDERGRGELLSETAITTIHSKLRRTKEERIAASKAGREKKTYGLKRAKLNPYSSTTNQQKIKGKSFTMMRQKRAIRGKGKRSFRERQISLRNSLLKQKRNK